jgi:hypothetical protein
MEEWQKAKINDDGSVLIPPEWLFLHYYEAFNILFRIENVLRMTVYIVLKDELYDKWVECNVTDDGGSSKTIKSLAKQRMSQATTFGYLGYPVTCPIMFLNSGELARLITSDAYWKYFKPYFLGAKEIIKNKLFEIEAIRNAMAHFRPIKEDDVEVIKQNSRHVLTAISPKIEAMLNCVDVVPTNTDALWYRELSVVGNDLCTFRLNQSRDGTWIRISMTFHSPVLAEMIRSQNLIWYRVTTVNSSAVLKHLQPLANLIIYLSEDSPFALFREGEQPGFKKGISFVFSRKTVEAYHQEIRNQLEELISTISKETELIQKDHLARGHFIHTVQTHATQSEKDKSLWRFENKAFRTPIVEGDPNEYWGIWINFYPDIVTATQNYPWMPAPISPDLVPF